ncbi:hypothetical protein ACFQU2_33285 [Siccirubricoccus deserti]
MMFFARWKTTAILAVCLLGILLCLPNLFPKAELPGWARQFSSASTCVAAPTCCSKST